MKSSILIIDFGSQLTKLIARRIRELGVFSEIVGFDKINKNYFKKQINGIILSGGPSSVDNKTSPRLPNFIYTLNIPILGICYGLQLLCKHHGGTIKSSEDREFGKNFLKLKKNSILTDGVYNISSKYQVWMSHSDKVDKIPNNFESVAKTNHCESAIVQNLEKNFFWCSISS